jgi:phage terminase small subunit
MSKTLKPGRGYPGTCKGICKRADQRVFDSGAAVAISKKKKQAFVEQYLKTWNAAEAAREAGYSEKTARQQGSRLLTNVDIQAAIESRLKELKMSADEVLLGLAEQARSNLGDHIKLDDTGFPAVAFDQSKMHLIKSLEIKPGEYGTAVKFEMYDAQAARVHLGRFHKLFTDKTDHSSDGKPLTFNILPALAAGSASAELPASDEGIETEEAT